MKKLLLLLCFFMCVQLGWATQHFIGPDKEFLTPNDMYFEGIIQDGDTINIDAVEYRGQAALAVFQADNLFIRGVGGMARLYADGEYIWGKGIWVFAGNNIHVEHISFEGAAVPDKNGAGIRLDGIGITVRHCYFGYNENGILTSNPGVGTIVIEHSEFDSSGHGDGLSHNLYVGRVDELVFRYNYSHGANIGHNLKSRAKINTIVYNRIMDEQDGNSSRIIDLSNGGYSVIMGNILMQGPLAENKNMIGYAREGYHDAAKNELYIVNNTFVSDRPTSCLFIDIENGAEYTLIANNAFIGKGDLFSSTVDEEISNYTEEDFQLVSFIDYENYDYSISMDSPLKDAGTDIDTTSTGFSLVPDKMYVHPLDFLERSTIGAIDIGAYETGEPVNNKEKEILDIRIYPNPVSDFLNISNLEKSDILRVIDVYGNDILNTIDVTSTTMDISKLKSGIYCLVIIRGERKTVKQFVKI